MAPMNWMLLYFLFNLLFIIIIIMNYFMFLYTPNMNKMKSNQIKIYWKW
uniref:ATP synthase F0 subunit 8 n=1 Tax=Coleoptera sp. 4 AH-2016 TaxID=1903826 RepID=A0A343C4K0_9COLE|nr:ATP synthase F0 subunit 8 [Coleoptera sp. 4 AH-2016]